MPIQIHLLLDKSPAPARHPCERMTAPADLEQLYDEHAQALFAFLLSLTRNDADTRDLLQQLFVRIAQRPMLPARMREPRAFLLRLAHNLAIDLARRRSARRQRQEQWVSDTVSIFAPTAEPDAATYRDALSLALGELAPEQRAVVHLKLWEGLTFEQIADVLELSPNTAASRYRYGIDKLRQWLRPLYDELK